MESKCELAEVVQLQAQGCGSSSLQGWFCLQVSESGVHRPHVAGIHGRSNDGAYSLVLAGGYEDDIVSAF